MVEFNALELRCPEFQIQMRRFLSSDEVKGNRVHLYSKEPRTIGDVKLFCAHNDFKFLGSEVAGEIHHAIVDIPA